MSTIHTQRALFALGLAATMAAFAPHACAHEGHDAHAAHATHQHQAEAAPGYDRQVVEYRVPAVTLVRADGTKASFPQEIDDGRPVLLNFIYTSCTAVCPILSQSFAEFQRQLGAERAQVRMVSVTIDPEEDTPRRLSDYAQRLEAGQQWGFYTGTVASTVTLQKAFKTYFGDKMHHRPVSFLRAAPGQPWVRLDGFTTPGELMAEYRRLMARDH